MSHPKLYFPVMKVGRQKVKTDRPLSLLDLWMMGSFRIWEGMLPILLCWPRSKKWGRPGESDFATKPTLYLPAHWSKDTWGLDQKESEDCTNTTSIRRH